MDETRAFHDDRRHGLQGPHRDLPAGFVPLRLRILPDQAPVEVTSTQALVGRHTEASVRLAHPEISRRHCWLHYTQGQWRVTDLSSLNGVFVNGEKTPEAVLYAGDEVRLGGVVLAIESATPVRVLKPESAEHEVIKQIAESLPNDPLAG